MSQWNIAAAQYAPQHNCIGKHVEHHLRFIAAAARLKCDLLVFPELSLTGPADADGLLPLPPSDQQLLPLFEASQSYAMTVIAGMTLDNHGVRQKGLALFAPGQASVIRYPHASGAYMMRGEQVLTLVDTQAASPNIDPQAALVTCCRAEAETRWYASINRLQRFAHKFAIPVLMANVLSGSALWDASGQLIVRADQGELLLKGSWNQQGWQGDLIPLR